MFLLHLLLSYASILVIISLIISCLMLINKLMFSLSLLFVSIWISIIRLRNNFCYCIFTGFKYAAFVKTWNWRTSFWSAANFERSDWDTLSRRTYQGWHQTGTFALFIHCKGCRQFIIRFIVSLKPEGV